MMTSKYQRRHYKDMVRILGEAKAEIGNSLHPWVNEDVLTWVEHRMVSLFTQDNPRFNPGLFYEAIDKVEQAEKNTRG